ncbi:oxepin-CoA hydrolase / 3-oxo-5,6-dehydrosuberyl-CoA semialdehyde dehydrogenase [Sulfitobacter brevis]|uniref:Oxepin-CoA hydrolase / 3-oxo-5,6-dehydrosuberyl-CoA semialdehyde dehydrogenase n=1 Tax=Sulfitobacter brevis TaxID=74348 RepID=A0A1I1YDT9_9RHOB|nr:phenylacetic acid degradation bifunctional protein PaaZ [Sulfitobacter brevis]SFE17785.1 oxepin-CoA hydrolase / 3-oxo-5,6-dehydrosuberyl-CoA semialdehyde dehydrogenase [Sulfitobacter brevis]
MRDISSFAAGQWIAPGAGARNIASAITGEVIAQAGNDALDVQAMLGYARDTGGPALRKMTFHDRARMLKALALHLREQRQTLYELSYDTGATLNDHKIDVDGGIGTMQVYAAKGRREMPDAHVYLDGPPEQLGRTGAFMGRHICTPLQGVAVHINAFNFPVWGMLEKLAPTLLAGVPAIVKPATATCYVTEACVRMMLDSGVLPAGALQLVSGGLGDMLDHLECQDAVAFTGSADTAFKLRTNPKLIKNSVRFASEQDSLNASVLGPDATPDTPEFDLFVKEVQREMTAKAGQKCTAIRRIMVPQSLLDPVIAAISARLARTTIGDPRAETTRMGALVSASQKRDVLEKAALLAGEAERVFGDPDNFTVEGADREKGAFVPPMLFHCADPDSAQRVHDTEAFGPVSTIMAYRDLGHAVALLNKGKGSLVASVITNDGEVAREITLGAAAFHGRLYFNNRRSMAEATGHGAPLPHMVHGGPGRAGGGEELGGVRGVMHYMQRTAIQGSPDILTAIGEQWVPGATELTDKPHPFTRTFSTLMLGETFNSDSREVTLEDIETFAHFTGDTFYAHMDDEAAKANPFFPGRVAHGYLLLSFAAGLFVQPDPGPVLANTGLDNLRFLEPVSAGDSIKVRLTVKHKTPRNDEYGEVRWHVTLTNQKDEAVAEYELLTMNAV